jgi:hypothetical protein
MGRKNESKSTRRVTSGAAELLNIASKAGHANQVSRETEAYRMADVSDFMDGYAGATIFRGIAMK